MCACPQYRLTLRLYSLSSKDQDKTRPLSTLANLAIIITDIQDMDPIFINLPYSTNIYEHSPPVGPRALWDFPPSRWRGGPCLVGQAPPWRFLLPEPLCMAGVGAPAQ